MSKYDKVLDLNTHTPLRLINNRIIKNSTVLEFGPATGYFTKYLKEEKNCIVDIVEYDEEAGKQAALYARNSIVGNEEGNIDKFYWSKYLAENKYDFIIFADVLEHLYNPQCVLLKCKKLLKNDGSILVSIPNIAHNSIILNLLRDEFCYTEAGLLDDTHIRFFTYNTFMRMLREVGLLAVYIDASFIAVGGNEILVTYDFFQKYDIDVVKNRSLGEVYQFIIELKVDNGEVNESECDNRLNDLIIEGKKKDEKYICSRDVLNQIQLSTGFKVLRKYYSIRDYFFPNKSIRRRLLKYIKRILIKLLR